MQTCFKETGSNPDGDVAMMHTSPTESREQREAGRRPPHGEKHPAMLPRLTKAGPYSAGAGASIQAKFRVNQPGDRCEQEADSVADRVMRMAVSPNAGGCAGRLQRKCDRCDEDKMIVQRKAARGQVAAPGVVHDALNSPGQPLDSSTRSFMESRFGYDFSGIRVHSDDLAARSAHGVNALAYTVGHHVVFGHGQYIAGDGASQRLLAHELTHTIQQGAAPTLPSNSNRIAVARGIEHASTLQRQAAEERTYNIQLTYPPSQTESFQGLTRAEALKQLHHFANVVDAHLEGGLAGHKYLKEIHDDQYIVAGISDFFGGRSIPSLAIWEAPRIYLNLAQALIKHGDVTAATTILQRAAFETRAADRLVYEYREGTIAGAERAVMGLQVVEVASSAVITVGTGGTAGVLIGAGYAGAQRLAGEISAVHYGLQQSIDWGGVAFDTAFALIAGKFGGQLGGALAKGLAAKLGGQMAARVTSQLVSGLLIGRASGILHGVAREVFDDVVRGRNSLTIDALINRVAEQMTLKAAFLDLVSSSVGAVAGEVMRPQAPEPAQKPPAGGGRPALKSIQGGIPGPVPMRDGRVASTPRTTIQSRGTVAVGAGELPAPMEAPIAAPRPAPHAVPDLPEPATAAASGSKTTPSPGPTAAAIAAAAGPSSTTSTSAPQVTLDLPPEKAAHAGMYASLIRNRQLEHTPNVPRRTAQTTRWDSALRPGGAMGIYPEIWQKFENMGISENRRLRPNWSRTMPRVDMQVDHKVEWQLLGPANRTWGDSITNYELLDQPSNSRVGPAIQNNIQRERERLATATGNPGWLTQRIVFNQLRVSGGGSGAMRWQPEEIQEGKHYDALTRFERDRLRRGR